MLGVDVGVDDVGLTVAETSGEVVGVSDGAFEVTGVRVDVVDGLGVGELDG